ncbi:MAG: acetate--CoA ligase family protein [Candidatus Marinimicrobia bacterium]|nr:acetate--CoA ligase family protein [Candidatus Neomarinimicrobiota bacterium]
MVKPSIKYLFEPKSIAVIGASENPLKIGHVIVKNIVEAGYHGKIYPVNPKGGEVLGHKIYSSITDINDEIDVATLVIPAKYAYSALEMCAAAGVKHLPIVSSGFSEIGNLAEERKLAKYAREHGMRILGPNIFGHYSAKVSLNATFGPRDIQKGNVAIITQSGALGIAMIGKTAVQNIGLSAIISVGNKSDIDEADLLEYLVEQDDTKIILIYIEGIQQGERLIKALSVATKVKPVIVIKSGRSKRGAIAAASHTGSLAGSDNIFDAIMRQCGVLRAESVDEALEWCNYLSNAPLPKGESTIIITNGGGVGVLATDACEKYSVKLYDDSQHLRDQFKAVTHGFGSTKNPIDLTGEASADEYVLALDVALQDKYIDGVLALYCETAMMTAEQLIKMIEDSYAKYIKIGKPVLFSLFGGEKTERCIKALTQKNIPVFRDVYNATSCLGVAYSFNKMRLITASETIDSAVDIVAIDKIIDGVLADNRQFMLAHEGEGLLKAAGLAGPRNGIARNIESAVKLADEIGYPVVMKIVSRDILHKSDVGGVLLDLDNQDEVVDAYQAIMHNCKAHKPDASIEGVEIVEQVKSGTEVIIGAMRDKIFGPIMMFGLGGIYVEVMKDVSFRALPLSRREVRTMIKEIRSYPLLLGVRGEVRKDIDGIVETIFKLGTIIRNCPRITDIEINPLMVYEEGQGVKTVDVRVLLSNAEKGENDA